MSQASSSEHSSRPSPTRDAPGSAPGQLRVDPGLPSNPLRAICYDREELLESVVSVDDLPALIERWPVTWLDVQGLGDAKQIEALGRALSIHPLALEDVVHTGQRPKVEEFGEQLFIVLRMVRQGEARTEQLSLLVTDRVVLSFQEESGDGFDPVRARLRRGRARIRSSGPDYLAYALLDAATDGYFPVIDRLAERLDKLDDAVVQRTDPGFIMELHSLRRDLQAVRHDVWPLRALLGQLMKGDLAVVADSTELFFRDCYDHANQLLDICEHTRDQASGLIEVALGLASQRMNEVMKVLTIMASLFIPLTFIAGIYGMNFDPGASAWNMPELAQPWGYPLALLAMLVVAIFMLLFFRRRGWLGGDVVPTPGAKPSDKA